VNQKLPELLYHYSNLQGLRGIIEKKYLHMTNVFWMDDTTEPQRCINRRECSVPLPESTVNRKISSFDGVCIQNPPLVVLRNGGLQWANRRVRSPEQDTTPRDSGFYATLG